MISADDYKKAKEGDLKAIENICRVTWEPLYRFIYYKVQNREKQRILLKKHMLKPFDLLAKK